MKKGKRTVAIVAVVCGAAIGASWSAHLARQYVERSTCQHTLRSLWCGTHIYRENHDGAFPQRLSDFLPNYFDNPRSFQCGRADQSPESLPSVDAWADYLWAYWPQGKNTPSDYPLAYDRRIQNHHGEGINVVTVGGGAFWDRRCEWLRSFLQRHPERSIPIPEGMNTEAGQQPPAN